MFAVFELILFVLVGAFLITQLIIPLIRQESLFPMFRKKRNYLQGQITRLNDLLEDQKLEKEVRAKKSKLDSSKVDDKS